MGLHATMSLAEFDNGYWYATELKEFAEKIGIPSANKLRKDELERAIKQFLSTGKTSLPTKRSLKKSGARDVLGVDVPVVNYTSNKETKDFIVREAKKRAPGLKEKSGARYRLNRWREEQLTQGRAITYGDLVDEYIRLNHTEGKFEKIPHGRYINFVAEFLANENGATRKQAIAAWEKLKVLDIPKSYSAWKLHASSRSRSSRSRRV
jgi:hypothetical protein